MWIIIASILTALVVTWAFTWFFNARQKGVPSQLPASLNSDCCGAHEVCDKDVYSKPHDEIAYYDDDELDIFKGRAIDSYTSPEIELFRDVLITMPRADVTGWLKSLESRDIVPPAIIREEALMVLSDRPIAS